MRSAFSLFRTYTFILRKGVDSGLADRMRNPRVRNIHPAVSHGFSGSGEKVSGRISYLCPGFRTLQQPMPDSVQKPMNDKTKILFVCLGNICRSPAAEGILRAMAARPIRPEPTEDMPDSCPIRACGGRPHNAAMT